MKNTYYKIQVANGSFLSFVGGPRAKHFDLEEAKTRARKWAKEKRYELENMSIAVYVNDIFKERITDFSE